MSAHKCNNLITATGDATISCCGKRMEALVAEKASDNHLLLIEPVEDELYVSSSHEMKKDHYITFVAYVTNDRVFIVKQYPEWNMQFRFHKLRFWKTVLPLFKSWTILSTALNQEIIKMAVLSN